MRRSLEIQVFVIALEALGDTEDVICTMSYFLRLIHRLIRFILVSRLTMTQGVSAVSFTTKHRITEGTGVFTHKIQDYGIY